MRKAIFIGLLAATLAPAMAQAQSTQDIRDERRADIRDQRQDVRERRQDARDARDGERRAEIRDERRDVRDARQDNRADWHDYRRAHPDVYRGQRWNGPRGYNYRPVNVGYRFTPAFYDRGYWIDPYRYHLRPVASWQRWVRYGNDVVLVDIRNGRVLEVNGGFFY